MASPKLTSLSYLGVGIEATPGTKIAPTAFIPIRGFKPQDVYQYVPDTGMRGQAVDIFGEYQGLTHGEYEVDGDFFPGSGGNLLAAIFGTDTLTGASSPYTHTFSVAADVPSYTVGDYYVAGYRSWPGQKASRLELKFSPESGLTHTTRFQGWPSATDTAPSTKTFETEAFFLGWEASITIGGTANTQLQNCEITLERQKSAVLFSAQDSQQPYASFVGPMAATWKLGFYMEDDTEYDLATGGTVSDVALTITQSGTSDSLVLTSTKLQFTKPTISRSGDFVLVELEGTSVYNATDSGVISAVLKNGVSGAYSTTAASS